MTKIAKSWSSAAIGIGFAVLCFVILMSGDQTLPRNTAIGVFAAECCGTIELNGGRLTTQSDSISYVIRGDKIGAYVLPKGLVGVAQGRVFIDRGRFPLKLRLRDGDNVIRIDIIDDGDATIHSFTRISPL